ncbi:anti-sigma factor [Arthrobacter sp. NPDC093139]|uniref:anti-sigma factor n=1 Tax=Arthrobacter sp. NPDC093139 TaxID=3363945 RepID=UPI00380B82F5
MHQLNRLLHKAKKSAASLPLAGSRHPGTPDHVRGCADCAAALRRQREYLARLRQAAVPAASDELTARLLLNTRELAMASAAPAPQAHPFRLAGLAAGGVAIVAAGAVMAGAYIAAGEPRPYAAAAFSGQAERSADAAGSGGTEAGDSSGADVSADPAAGSNVAVLRSHGWACPDLQVMGFHIVSATSKVYAGRPAVELRLSDGQHTATVLEQRSAPAASNPELPAASALPEVPVNPLTGHPASSDGFVAVNAAGPAGAGRLWIKATAPWSAIYQTGRSTFTYVSDLPAHAADDAVAALAAAGRPVSQVGLDHGVAADPGPETRGSGDESVVERLERGLRRLALHLDKMTGHLAR